ncbi:hypothetical protein [Pseudomonas sp. NBRC 111124]|uniref:hypothetical protein n=1 Tax=Pseudomonas sp. NBRC 111124 TaxID=1661039 RepID=UPI0007612E8F|nr:hypothetical protein [Pseudomonas sp. NBRC 111124]
MEFFRVFEILALGFYSAAGVALFMGLYMLNYGARCLDAWRKRETLPTDRVLFHLIVAALIGLLAGCFAQGLVDMKSACDLAGQQLGPCLFSR